MIFQRFHIVFFILITLAIIVPTVSYAQGESQKDIKRIEKEVSERKRDAAKLAVKERKTAQELERLRAKLIQATTDLQTQQTHQQDLEARLEQLEMETNSRGGNLKESRQRLAKMTSALLQLSRKPPGMLFLHEESPDAHVHRTILLQSMLPRLRKESEDIMHEIDNFKELQEQTANQQGLVKAARQNLQKQRYSLDQLVRVRQGLLTKTKAEKEMIEKQLKRLRSEATNLRQLMEKVSKPAWRKKVIGKKKELEPRQMKAGLKIPIAGKILHNFGEKDDFGVVSEGVTLQGVSGAPVIAPQSGRVVFKGPFRGYGKVVILQHPGGFHSFLSGFSRIDADMGQRVDAGEPLGILPINGVEKPKIYFEWRKGTEPINPIKKI